MPLVVETRNHAGIRKLVSDTAKAWGLGVPPKGNRVVVFVPDKHPVQFRGTAGKIDKLFKGDTKL